ncbi:hypothetical protein ES332_A07G161700v1 [Gossypium tomentosum]|uniref:Uncharacterized protein n=1 Tax=Gossypium tomentosum TaxID=34277 RepID=A0A5D2PW50_GOSTO|nr:hypothetical protein ES332_A07G161700v1 [Gossypium tomentosum]
MTESTKVRLVLCPKCENLLPELAEYSVYKCGGCGAVLRAKTENCEPETSSEKLEEDRLGQVPTKFRIFSEKDIVDSCDAGGKSTAGSFRCDTTRNEPKLAADKCCVDKGNDISANKNEVVNLTGTENQSFDSKFGHTGGSQILGHVPDWEAGKQEEMEGFPRIPRDVTEDHPDEGPSNRQLDASYGLQAQTDQDGSGRILLEEDRVMLLRKLDEIKEQLSRSCNVVDKPKDKVPLDGRVAPPESFGGVGSWFPNGSSASQNPSLPFYGPDEDGSRAGTSYFAQFPESDAYPVANAMTPHGRHPRMLDPNHVPAYFGPRVLGRTSHQLPGEYQQLPPHPYLTRQYNGSDHHQFMPYPQSSVLHHASCSCFHCYEKHQQVPAPVPTSAFGNRRFPDMPSNPMYHIENPGTLGSRTAMPPPLNVHGTQAHARLPRDINSETGGGVQGCPQRMVLAGGGRRLCPMAGGAPFTTCYNCFELLQMPRKLQLMVKNEQQVRCGACSTVINFLITNKKLVLRDHAKAMEISVEAGDISNEVAKDCSSHFRGHANQISANFSSDDYDLSGYEFQSMDREPNALSMGKALNSVKAQDMRSICSSSPSISQDENSPNREKVNSIDQPIKSILAPPPAGSPLQEHFDYSANNRAVNIFGKGNHSNRPDLEIVVSNNGTTRQSSFKEASLPTEMEVAFNEYSNTGTSQDSRDGIEEDDQPKMTRGGESFFANIIKNNFKDSSKYNQIEERGKRNVSVNGHPLPERVVKKAEKTAGRIQSGQYWYDFRAGFWGVLGGPCLGIIPPHIEEFNYPMPENCAGGSSGVFVNGRELHQKDLELLANRGLPTDRDRYYIIEISGRVLDEDTGEELCKLGKLAPTVLKVKHGFGMKVRRAAV